LVGQLLAGGLLCATLFGQLLGARLFLAGALLFGKLLRAFLLGLLQALLLGQLLCPLLLGLMHTLLLGQLSCQLLLGLMHTLLLGQLLCPLLLGLLHTLLLGQLLSPLLLGLLHTLLLGQLLCPLLLGLMQALLLGQLNASLLCQLLCARLLDLFKTLLLSLLHPLLIGEPPGTLLFSHLLALLLGQLPHTFLFGLTLRFLACAGLRVFGGTLLGKCRIELRGLFREPPPLFAGLGAQAVLRVGTQPGVVCFTLADAVTLALLRQAHTVGLCVGPGRGVVGDGLFRRRRLLHAGGRLRRGIGFHGRQRDVERRRPLRFLRDHACVQAVRHVRRRRPATALCRPRRRRSGRGRGRERRRRGRDGIDEPETVIRHIRRRIRLCLRQRHGRERRRR
jgi:hypothetical protein